MELLIHASAPSARRDDEKVKRQARAYSGFETATTVVVHQSVVAPPRKDIVSDPSLVPASDGSDFDITPWAPSVFLDDTQLARTALESQLLTSSLLGGAPDSDDSNVNEPTDDSPASEHIGLPNYARGSQYTQKSRASLKRKQGTASRERSDKRRHPLSSVFVPLQEDLQFALGYVGPSSPAEAALSTPTRGQAGLTLPQQQQSRSSRSNDIPSQLPSTYSLSDVTSKASSRRSDFALSSPVRAASPTPSRKGKRPLYPASSPLRRSARINARLSLSPLPEGPQSPLRNGAHTAARCHGTGSNNVQQTNVPCRVEDVQAVDGTKITAETSSPKVLSGRLARGTSQSPTNSQGVAPVLAMQSSHRCTPQTAALLAVNPAKPGQLEELRNLTRSVYPGPPETSSEPFTSHVTPVLINFYSNEILSKRYQPSFVLRPLRQSERGHWLIDMNKWPIETRIKFWRFLEQHVGSGSAGWGVWCSRDDLHDGDQSTSDIDRQMLELPTQLDKVKVHCWGEIVQHVYQMLYVASNARIRSTLR